MPLTGVTSKQVPMHVDHVHPHLIVVMVHATLGKTQLVLHPTNFVTKTQTLMHVESVTQIQIVEVALVGPQKIQNV